MRGFAPHWLKLAALALAASPVAACGAETPVEGAAPAPSSLALTGRVVDAANVLTPQQELVITDRLALLEQETKVQFVVVTTPSLAGRDIESYSTQLGNDWGVGDRERNDGLLLVVAPTEQKVRIATGPGLVERLSDKDCQDVINWMLPFFRAGDLPAGISFGVNTLDGMLRGKFSVRS